MSFFCYKYFDLNLKIPLWIEFIYLIILKRCMNPFLDLPLKTYPLKGLMMRLFSAPTCASMADGNVSQPKKNHHYILILSFEFVMWDDQLTRALTARKQPVILIYRYIRDAEIGNLIKVEKTEFICFRNIALHCHQI